MNVFRRFLPYFRPYAGLVFVSVILSTAFSFLSAISIYIILPIMELIFPGGTPQQAAVPAPASGGFLDSVKEQLREWMLGVVITEGDAEASLISLCILVVLLFLMKNIVKFAAGLANTKIEQGVAKDVRDDLFGKSIALPIPFFNNQRAGDLISVFTNEIGTMNAALIPMFIKLTRDPLEALMLLFLLLALSPQLTLIAFSTSILTVLLIRVLRRYIRRYSIRMQDALQNITTRLQESFQNIRIVKAYAGERFETARFKKETGWYIQSAIKHSIVSNLAGPIGEIIAIAALAIVLFYGGLQVLDGAMRAEELITFLFLLFSIMGPIVGIFQIPTSIQRGVVAGERVMKLMESEPEGSNGAQDARHLRESLEVRNVTFSYREGRPVLRNVSLTVRRGETIALVGPSGGGKSTLMDLLIRFYDPDSGSLTVDGTDIREFRLESYRSLFGIVTQESLLFNETVRNNIAYAMPEATDAQIVEAAKIANAHGFIEELPNGYDTLIGDRGILLSGGQRQRIAIARAVVRNPEILLFDEATSALDTESEILVQRAIEKVLQDRTAVVIAHRLSTIRNANRIAVVDGGEIREEGTHEELLARDGVYRLLHDAQFREAEIYRKAEMQKEKDNIQGGEEDRQV